MPSLSVPWPESQVVSYCYGFPCISGARDCDTLHGTGLLLDAWLTGTRIARSASKTAMDWFLLDVATSLDTMTEACLRYSLNYFLDQVTYVDCCNDHSGLLP